MTIPACTPFHYKRAVLTSIGDYDVDPREVLAGNRDVTHTVVRWAAWRSLIKAGFSYNSIGKTSGFDHTSVRYAHRRANQPYAKLGRPKKVPNEQASA